MKTYIIKTHLLDPFDPRTALCGRTGVISRTITASSTTCDLCSSEHARRMARAPRYRKEYDKRARG